MKYFHAKMSFILMLIIILSYTIKLEIRVYILCSDFLENGSLDFHVNHRLRLLECKNRYVMSHLRENLSFGLICLTHILQMGILQKEVKK